MATYILGVDYDNMHITLFKAEADNLQEAVKKVLRHYLASSDSPAYATAVILVAPIEEADEIEPLDISREDLGEICLQENVVKYSEEYREFDAEEQEEIEELEALDGTYLLNLMAEEVSHPKFTAVEVWSGEEPTLSTLESNDEDAD